MSASPDTRSTPAKPPPLVLGLDGGGTKVECLIATADGEVLGYGRGGPCNANFVSAEVARSSIDQAIEEALAACAVRPAEVAVACSSVTHSAAVVQEVMAERLAVGRHLAVAEDEVVRAGSQSNPPAVVIIAGTGSIALAMDEAGRRHSVGGWGSLLGDEGSAWDIAMRGIVAALRAWDGRGEPTALSEAVLRHFRLDGIPQLGALFYGRRLSRHEIAAFAPEVTAAARAGDPVARGILRAAGRELGLAAAVLIRRLGWEDRAPEVIVGGGVADAGGLLLRAVRSQVRRAAPNARVRSRRFPAVVGATLVALEALGRPPDDALIARLKRQYARARRKYAEEKS